MKSFAICLMSLLVFVATGAAEQPSVSGQVRLSDGQPVAGAQVLLFDLANLRRYVGATADEGGQFALSLGTGLPQGFALGQNYPNPFNPGTVIPYQLATDGYVRLEVFNLLGQRVATLVDGEQLAGAYAVPWDARDAAGYGVAAGVYIYRLTAGGESATRRMVLVDGSAGFGGSASTSSADRVLLGGGRVEAEGSAYGLVVFGDGMVAHVEAGLRVGAGPLVVEVQRAGRGKTTQVRIQLLGDVDNNGQVNIADALLVMAYSLGASLAMPNGGDIALGDVNGDGRVDGEDARLIELYSTDPSFPGLPAGIGKPQSEGDVPRRAMTVALAGGEQMEFVWVAPGTFRMGSGGEGWDDERPQHEVMVGKGFYLGRYEVTQGQWEAVMGTTPWAGKARVRSHPWNPAVYISWEDAQAFISRLNSAAGETLYRLPTEAEWEYAGRAGTATRWSFGDEASALGDYAWYEGNVWGGEEEYARAVGTKLPNHWGLYDMQGNVWEWVQDWYDKSFYHRSPRLDPQGPAVGSGRVLRGGGFGNVAKHLRSAYRYSYAPDYRSFDVGMRLLRLVEAEPLGGTRPVQGPIAPDDDHGNSPADATPIGTVSTTLGYLSENDEDYFRLTVDSPTTLTAYVDGTGDLATVLRITDSSSLSSFSSQSSDSYIYTEAPVLNSSFLSPSYHWVSARVSPGTYYIRVESIASLGPQFTLGNYTLHTSVSDFNIDLVFVNDNDWTADHKRLFQEAALRWMSIITGDLPDIDYSSNPRDITIEEKDFWFDETIRVDDVVDDLRIYVKLVDRDGLGGTLASAGPKEQRDAPFSLPCISLMAFDEADIADSFDDILILHEMGHALGFTNAVWREKDLLKGMWWDAVNSVFKRDKDVRFIGWQAIQAFDNAGGRNYNGGDKVPVENGDQDDRRWPKFGTEYGHWRESVFSTELMIGWKRDHAPLSAITIQSLADLGYQVDVRLADEYRLPTDPALGIAKPVADHGVELTNCVLPGPIRVVDANGRVVRTIGE